MSIWLFLGLLCSGWFVLAIVTAWGAAAAAKLADENMESMERLMTDYYGKRKRS